MTRRLRLCAAVLLLATLAGCGGSGQPGPAAPVAAAPPRPLGVEDPAVIATPSGGPAAGNCDPFASLRPPATLPAPEQMPAGTAMARIATRGRLVVGVDQDTYLFGYRNPATGQIEGFDIDVAREVARAIFGDPDRIQLVAITSAQRIPFVNSGTVDLVAHTMTINCARLQQVNFSTVYYEAGQRVLVERTSKVQGITDLGGKKVCAAAGSTSIQNIAAAPSKPVPVAVPDWADCLVLLQQGQIEAISTDDTILLGMAQQDPNTQLVGPRFTSEPYGLAIAKSSPELVRFVNGVLDRMRTDGRLAGIGRRWLGAEAPPPPPSKYQD
jgi:polar amino acid transport system substrate-binding protein